MLPSSSGTKFPFYLFLIVTVFSTATVPGHASIKAVREYFIDSAVTYQPCIGYCFLEHHAGRDCRPVVATKNGFVTAWITNEREIRCSRISRTGELIDSAGIPANASSPFPPAIASDGTNYLIAWRGEYGNLTPGAIYYTRINESLQPIDDVKILCQKSGLFSLSTAFGKKYYLLAWQEEHGGAIQFIRMLPSGKLVDTVPQPLGSGVNFTSVAMLFDGNDFLLAWSRTDSTIVVKKLTEDGVLSTIAHIACNTEVYCPAIAKGNTNRLVVWPQPNSLYGALFTPTDSVEKPKPFFIQSGDIGNRYQQPSVAFDGSRYFITWDAPYGVKGIHVTENGISAQMPVTITDSGLGNFMVSGDNDHFIIWQNKIVEGARVSFSGSLLNSIMPVSLSGNTQTRPSLSTDGKKIFTQWSERRLYEDLVKAKLYNGTGFSGAGKNIAVSSIAKALGYPPPPAPVSEYGDGAYVSLCVGQRTKKISLLSTEGKILDSAIQIPWNFTDNSIDFDGERYKCAHQTWGEYKSLHYSAISISNTTIGTDTMTFKINNMGAYDITTKPKIACGKTNSLIVYKTAPNDP